MVKLGRDIQYDIPKIKNVMYLNSVKARLRLLVRYAFNGTAA